MSDVICLGEALIDFLPVQRREPLKTANTLRRAAGGAPANLAVGLARLGVKAAFLGKVGADPFGYFLRDTLVANNVDTDGMLFSQQYNTGLAFAWVDDPATGEAKYLFYRQPSADRFLEASEIDWQWFGHARILQFGSLILASSPGREAAFSCIEKAHQNGQLCCYDVNMRLPAWRDHATARAGMLEPLPLCDILKLNRHELAFLTGETDLKRGVAALWRPEYKLMLVTLDSDGCYFRNHNGDGFLPGFKVQTVDTVGAGDGWLAGFLSCIIARPNDFVFEDSATVAAACNYANACGALTTMRAGAIPALPTKRQVTRFLKTLTPTVTGSV